MATLQAGTESIRDGYRALFWLTWGSFLPIFGWLNGVSILWANDRLDRVSKVVGTIFPVGGWFAGGVALLWIVAQSGKVCDVSPTATGAVVEECQRIGLFATPSAVLLMLLVVASCAIGPTFLRLRLARLGMNRGSASREGDSLSHAS